MGAGLDWDEWRVPYSDPKNIRYQEMADSDPVPFVLNRALVDKPGVRFNYNGGLVTIVGQLLAEQTEHDNFADFMRNSPMQSLCLEHAYIEKQAGNTSNTAGGAYLRPRDMLKLGILLDNNGEWQGKQIMAPEWVKAMTTPYIATPIYSSSYGYYWWIDHIFNQGKTYQVNYALGYGGQLIAVVDDLDLVVVRTASNYDLLLPHSRLMREFILPAFTLN
ncbi:putative Beta-lactamase [Vibrio ichthyoenteri ATCC 700023]|uniref:Putative Beta-lactamase n=1 Tax=Vibrio ichthyoenteri ATCC 700023 TaxID=870968 RepID=F9RYT6_9VIBR|nr:putative Beta-lactamase [Vibrio ichthyoenteri ATCC 700023]